MILDIDSGSSRIKWRVLDPASKVVARGSIITYGADLPAVSVGWQGFFDQLKRVRIGNVAGVALATQLQQNIRENCQLEPEFAYSTSAQQHLQHSYTHPEHLGVDRWLGMLAATQMVEHNFCIADCGSALTIDLAMQVAGDWQHLGGYIIPGRHAMFKALLGKAPSLRNQLKTRQGSLANHPINPADNTPDAIENGVVLALCSSIQTSLLELINHCASDNAAMTTKPINLILTGGDSYALSVLLSNQLKNNLIGLPKLNIIWRPELVLEGIPIALP